MTVQDYLDHYTEGLSLLFQFARDVATEVKAIEAFLEVVRLQVARS